MPPISSPIARSFFGITVDPTPESVQPETLKMTDIKQDDYIPSNTRECDFDKDPSKLYLELHKKNWEGVIARSETDYVEARTWVFRKKFDGKLRWRLLPVHAAIIFKAPEHVIEALLGAYPRGAECKDDRGMLPLHLAFRKSSSEDIVNLLLVAYPQSIDVKDRKGRIPLVLAQASTSPNRDAFMRALERGPTYYAVAAAATERAAVTAELRAIFDAKLMEIKNQHQDEIEALKEDSYSRKQGLEERLAEVEVELNKTQETSQILVDHVNSLEAQLTSRSDTERFLATKIASLDTSLRDVSRVKEENEGALQNENKNLTSSHEALKAHATDRESTVASLTAKLEEMEAENEELMAGLHVIKKKSVEEIQGLEMEWATARANGAVLEAQLKKKIETEHSLACQVSSLASKLAESAYESSNVSVAYASRVDAMMNERTSLRNTVAELTKKLTFVAKELQKVSSEQDQIIAAAAEHEATMHEASKTHAKILANAEHHEAVIEKVNEERLQILNVLSAQEQAILSSAGERERLRETISLQVEQVANSVQKRENLLFRVNQQKEDVRRIVEEDLGIIPKSSSDTMDDADIVDEVVRRTTAIKEEKDAEKMAAVKRETAKMEAEQKILLDQSKAKREAEQKMLLDQSKREAEQKMLLDQSTKTQEENKEANPNDQSGTEQTLEQALSAVDRVEAS